MDSSDFFGFLSCRSSVREYEDDPLTEEETDYILKSASTAPSAGNLEAWDVVVVTEEETRGALAEAAFGQVHLEKAATVFVVCANYVRSMSRYGERGILYAVEDATIACTYMMLAAHAKKIHTCWTGAFNEDEVREILDLPQHIRPIALLAAGKGETPTSLTERMPTGEHVHREQW
ncbi:nitroreductase family protein [uncultured Methanoregula sp.]|uniref:nitroreductase family protein n=1 Tax=uncultured Methanoregula sp. TaxID=1005933 RepID=UPI002AAB0174|nr:nitroreductase family protein [uncultured Methanoregula sp.]